MDGAQDKAGAATALGSIGTVYLRLGDYGKALSFLERALATNEELGDKAGAATALGNIGCVHFALGDCAKAFSSLSRALSAKEALGSGSGPVAGSGGVGLVQCDLGDYAKALPTYERALAMKEALGDRAGAVLTLRSMGGRLRRPAGLCEGARNPRAGAGGGRVARGQGARGLDAEQHRERAGGARRPREGERDVRARAGGAGGARRPSGAAWTRFAPRRRPDGLGDVEQARACLERALETFEARGDAWHAAWALARARPRSPSARASTPGARLRAPGGDRARVDGARARRGGGSRRPGAALAGLRRGRPCGDGARRRLRDSRSSSRAAARARCSRDSSARETLWSAAISPALTAEEVKARFAETAATRALQEGVRRRASSPRSARGGPSSTPRRSRSRPSIARIQREAKAGGVARLPEAATLDDIRATLADGDALVLYGLVEKGACALVVTPDDARIVDLGASRPIDAAAHALTAGSGADDATGVRDARDPDAPLRRARGALDARRGAARPAGRRRSACSSRPTGALALRALRRRSRPDVTSPTCPSGTTYGVLREERPSRGDGVLALGDPDYARGPRPTRARPGTSRAGSRLAPLPETREEATARRRRRRCSARTRPRRACAAALAARARAGARSTSPATASSTPSGRRSRRSR